MARFLINLLFFLLPFATYWLFMVASRRVEDRPDLEWEDAPFKWLVVAGLALGVGSMIVLGYYTGQETQARYEPAQLIEGEIEPSGVRE
ncbi:MAG: DUF6111 family protein [Parvibaculaceae bacterium]